MMAEIKAQTKNAAQEHKEKVENAAQSAIAKAQSDAKLKIDNAIAENQQQMAKLKAEIPPSREFPQTVPGS